MRAGLGGHAVDLFGPAVTVAEWMGVLPQVQAARTHVALPMGTELTDGAVREVVEACASGST